MNLARLILTSVLFPKTYRVFRCSPPPPLPPLEVKFSISEVGGFCYGWEEVWWFSIWGGWGFFVVAKKCFFAPLAGGVLQKRFLLPYKKGVFVCKYGETLTPNPNPLKWKFGNFSSPQGFFFDLFRSNPNPPPTPTPQPPRVKLDYEGGGFAKGWRGGFASKNPVQVISDGYHPLLFQEFCFP